MANSVVCKRITIYKTKLNSGKWHQYEKKQVSYTYPPGELGAEIITAKELSKIKPIEFKPRSSPKERNELKERLKSERRIAGWRF